MALIPTKESQKIEHSYVYHDLEAMDNLFSNHCIETIKSIQNAGYEPSSIYWDLEDKNNSALGVGFIYNNFNFELYIEREPKVLDKPPFHMIVSNGPLWNGGVEDYKQWSKYFTDLSDMMKFIEDVVEGTVVAKKIFKDSKC